ncbi:unnamed protein product [Lepeophtheirus salmonis]|uniref:(salmon louse) hypothetical protein n=1 Tax=Lepeophtheirus salmonis TaxID=72036 RepID=A0A7R8HBQ6_LEPSM|nr:unnamed protein product [Lepeophtheirus salmonis]CAF2991702.1 unnamed protein product [Lepeophtheirus salmonis]
MHNEDDDRPSDMSDVSSSSGTESFKPGDVVWTRHGRIWYPPKVLTQTEVPHQLMSQDHSPQSLGLSYKVFVDHFTESNMDVKANLVSIVKSFVPNPFIGQENIDTIREGQLCGT